MEASSLAFMEDLLDFSSDIGEEDDEEDGRSRKALPYEPRHSDDPSRSFPELPEEELEWLSNKDAFPAVETFVDILTSQPNYKMSKHHSPVSVLDDSSTSSSSLTLTSCCGNVKVPVRARSKHRQRRARNMIGQERWFNRVVNLKNAKVELKVMSSNNNRNSGPSGGSTTGRKCQHCGAEKTPQWRAGPLGPKTLCNACGVRYKSGRLVPEYRPASSPTFSVELHSNSHRKVMEMRMMKQLDKG